MVNPMVKYSQNLDSTFRALADPTRRAILAALTRGQMPVSALAAPHRMSLPAVMKHLQVLERAGLVRQRKKGRVRHCRLSAQPLKQAETWLSKYRMFWGHQMDSLDRYLTQRQTSEARAWTKRNRQRA
jgi:DNA-binding transcriptional ArsR family regulator